MPSSPLGILNVGYRSTNYWLVIGQPGRLLVDLGWPGTLGAMEAALLRMDVPIESVRYGIATHYHPDHAGLANDLKSRGMSLIVLESQGKPVATGPEARHNVIPNANANVRLTFAGSRAFLAGIGIAGSIIPTPGHSDDSISIVLDDGIAFTGDLTPLELATDEQREAVTLSWNRLHEAGARTVYPGHGPPRPMPPRPR
jgi:glyoxylase-like metal-dependent hydrolase (beta-lactamase superfamily II)